MTREVTLAGQLGGQASREFRQAQDVPQHVDLHVCSEVKSIVFSTYSAHMEGAVSNGVR